MTDALIRPARAGDAPVLAELGRRTFIETFVEGFAIPYPAEDLAVFMDGAFSTPVVAERLADPAQMWWIAERGGAALAFANAGQNGLPHADARPGDTELKRLYVAREAQGQGVGTRLLATALDWMTENGSGAHWIGVWSGNLKAQKLYAAHGFEKAGEYLFPVGGWSDEEFILRRDRPDRFSL